MTGDSVFSLIPESDIYAFMELDERATQGSWTGR